MPEARRVLLRPGVLPFHRLVVLVPALVGCTAPLDSEPEAEPAVDSPRAAPLRAQAAARGIPDHVALIERPTASRHVQHFDLQWDGVPVPGIGGVIRTDLQYARLAAPRLDLEAPPITIATIDEAGARAAAVATLVDARARRATLALRPAFEQRLRADADAAGRAPTATDFEQVIRRLELRWLVELEVDDGRWLVEVDATDGTVTAPRPAAITAVPTELRDVTAVTHYHGTRTIRVGFDPDSDWENYRLVDARGNEVRTPGASAPYVSDDARFGDGFRFISDDLDSPNGETAAVDALVALDVTWRMFQDHLGLEGPFDGTGELILVEVHHQMANASWQEDPPELHLGYRDLTNPIGLKPMATIDVVGHEVGHGFFMRMSGTDVFDYLMQSELAGLSEATGDIIGTLAEHHRPFVLPAPWSGPPPNFTLGEQMGMSDGEPYARSMKTPEFPVWTPTLEGEDPHLIAGPIDRMFWALCVGFEPYTTNPLFAGPDMSEHVPDGFAGIGLTKAGMIWRDTTMVLRSGDTLASSRGAAIEVAEARYGWNSVERKAVADAFAAVNIGPPADRIAPVITQATATQIAGAVRIEFLLQEPGAMTRRDPRATVDGSVTITATIPGHGGGSPLPSPTPTLYRADIPISRIPGSGHNGQHTAIIEAWDDWGNRGAVTLTFTAETTRPVVTASVGGSGKLPIITATATDPSGVARVELKRGGTLITSDLSAPYVFALDTSTWPDGGHDVTIEAYDPYGNRGSALVMITADNTAPAITLTATGAQPPFAVTATAIDASSLVSATFLRDGTTISTDASAPFQTSYVPQDGGAHTLGVRMRDSFGNEGTATITAPLDQTGPQVTAEAVQLAGAVTLTASVTDTCGVQFPMTISVDGVIVLLATTATASVALPNALFVPGPHLMTVDASDRCGNARRVERPFTIFLNTPAVTAAVVTTGNPKAPRITATTVHDRPITKVVFRRTHTTGSLVLGEDTTAPYELTLDTSAWPDGLHEVEAMAIDNIGWAGFDVVGGVRADNTAPQVSTTWSYANRVLYFDAVPTDAGAGLAPGVMMNMFLLTPQITDVTAPYLYSFTIPWGTTSGNFVFSACAADTFGNDRCALTAVAVVCNRKMNCTASPGTTP